MGGHFPEINSNYKIIYFVNHAHSDLSWWSSVEGCRKRNIEIIERAIDLSQKDPEFYYSQELVQPVCEFLKEYPQKKDILYQLIRENRIEVGSFFSDVASDYCFDESLVRNIYMGKKWLEKTIGTSSQIAYEEDVFGHALQLPQILAKAGIKYLKISRGKKRYFHWQGLEGAKVLTACVEYGWSFHSHLGENFEKTLKLLPNQLKKAEKRFRLPPPYLLIPDGDDCTLPNENLTSIAREWNKNIENPKIKVSTLEEFFKSIEKINLPTYQGDMPNPWVAAATIEVRTMQKIKEAENFLTTAEKFSTMAQILSSKKNNISSLNEAWRLLLLTQDHNWGAKKPEKTSEENDRIKLGYVDECLKISKEVLQNSLDKISSKIKIKNLGIPLAIFNQLSWQRGDFVEVKLNFEENQIGSFILKDWEENEIAYQILHKNTYENGSLRSMTILFKAENVPSLGYKVYYLVPKKDISYQQTKSSNYFRMSTNYIENDRYLIELLSNGIGIKKIFDKVNKKVIKTSFRKSIIGPLSLKFIMGELLGIGLRFKSAPDDFFEKHPNKEGSGEEIEITKKFFRSRKFQCEVKPGEKGPLRASLIIEGNFIESKIKEEIFLYENDPRIDFNLTLNWHGRDSLGVGLSLPLKIKKSKLYFDVPYAISRKGDEVPDSWIIPGLPLKVKMRGVQNWFDLSTPDYGITVATKWPAFDFTLIPLALLLFSTKESAFFSGDFYRQIGEHVYKFSFLPHQGDIFKAKTYREGKYLTYPLIPLVIKENKAKTLPEEYSFCQIKPENLLITALKKCEDDESTIIRFYEIEGKEVEASIEFFLPLKKAYQTDILENEEKELLVEGNKIKMKVLPYSICTIKTYYTD